MATGRTVSRWTRLYADGYDLSSYTMSVGPLDYVFEEADLTTLGDAIRGVLPNKPGVKIGTLNGVFDNTATSGLHTVISGAGTYRTVMIPIGIRAEPAAGDPVFNGIFLQGAYQASGDGPVTVSVPFSDWYTSQIIAYSRPWGNLLHANSARTSAEGANTGSADVDGGASSSAGGYMAYQVFAGNGTATISVDDSANNSDWLALSGATTGSVDWSTVAGGLVALGTTATVRQYLRWQVAFGTATSITFALAFVRG